jgi:predicted lipoprotein with Yx(FWY)xxD motif
MMHRRTKAIALLAAVSALAAGGCGEDSASSEQTSDQGPAISIESGEGRHVLVDAAGQTLYYFSGDKGGAASACFGACAKAWRPLIVGAAPKVGPGIDEELVRSTQRPDGKPQATFDEWPLYTRAGDTGSPQDEPITAFGGDWRPMQASGVPPNPRLPFIYPTALISIGEVPGLGRVLLDSAHKTYYYFDRDTRGAGKSTCFEACAGIWRPKASGGTPVTTEGADPALAGAFERSDGLSQATYDGWPLYTYIRERNEKSEGVGRTEFGGTFHPLRPDGSPAD